MQSLNFFKKTLHIYHIYVRLSNLYMIIKMCVAAKILEICIFCFFGFPLNFDEEKWYYMYIEQFLKNDVSFIFCHNFMTRISNLVILMGHWKRLVEELIFEKFARLKLYHKNLYFTDTCQRFFSIVGKVFFSPNSSDILLYYYFYKWNVLKF